MLYIRGELNLRSTIYLGGHGAKKLQLHTAPRGKKKVTMTVARTSFVAMAWIGRYVAENEERPMHMSCKS